MKTVWIVIQHEIDEACFVLGVFSTEEKARDYLAKYKFSERDLQYIDVYKEEIDPEWKT